MPSCLDLFMIIAIQISIQLPSAVYSAIISTLLDCLSRLTGICKAAYWWNVFSKHCYFSCIFMNAANTGSFGKDSHVIESCMFNSLAPGRYGSKSTIFKLIIQNRSLGAYFEITLKWIPLNFTITIEKSILVQVMAWCHQAPHHYLSQCWPRSMSFYGITRLTIDVLKFLRKYWNIPTI